MFKNTITERMEMCDGRGRFTAELNGDTVLLHVDGPGLQLPATVSLTQFTSDIEARIYGPI